MRPTAEVETVPINREVMVQSLVEECLPCHLLHICEMSIRVAGYQLREDTRRQLSVGAAAPLRAVADDGPMVGEVAKKVDDLVRQLLHVLSPENPLHCLYCCATFNLMLVEEGLLADARNVGVLVSLVVMTDLKNEEGVENYTMHERILYAEGRRILAAVRSHGYFGGVKSVSLAMH